MIVVACFETVILGGIVFLFLRAQQTAERAWADERRELLNRIQRPDMVPLTAAKPFIAPDPEPDEIDLVGVVQVLEPE